MRDDLLGLTAHVEAFIDFPDEDIDPDTGAALLARFDAALAVIGALLATADRGRILREGVRTVIYGEPNVGKSSLLNALAGYDRAIVSPMPGTTRDTVEEFINVRGLALRLIDTAGLRESVDPLEREGMARTRQTLARADLALRVADASQPPGTDLSVGAGTPPRPGILVLNKLDLGLDPAWQAAVYRDALPVSCLTGEGMDTLTEAIHGRITGGQTVWSQDAAVAINTRHQACLVRARQSLETARTALAAGESPEFVAVDLRGALDAVGEITGGTDYESILDRLFSTFCIGK